MKACKQIHKKPDFFFQKKKPQTVMQKQSRNKIKNKASDVSVDKA